MHKFADPDIKGIKTGLMKNYMFILAYFQILLNLPFLEI